MFSVYILWSDKLQKFYIGQTSNLEDRIYRHNHGYEKYTSKGMPWTLIWSTQKKSRQEAMTLERKLKNYTQKRLRDFISKNKS